MLFEATKFVVICYDNSRKLIRIWKQKRSLDGKTPFLFSKQKKKKRKIPQKYWKGRIEEAKKNQEKS